MRRARRLREYALVAAILCLVPPLLWSEWTTPDPWGPRERPPRWQTVPFVALVYPPVWIANAITPVWNGYGCAVGASTCGCWGYFPRPLRAAGEFWSVGYVFWLGVIAGLGELSVAVRTRYTREKVRAGTS